MLSRLPRRFGDGEPAQAVVAAELDDDDVRLQGEDVAEAVEAILGGVAADALVDDAVVIAVCGRGPSGGSPGSFRRVGAVAGGEAVAEADDERAIVVGVAAAGFATADAGCGRSGRLGRGCGCDGNVSRRAGAAA